VMIVNRYKKRLMPCVSRSDTLSGQ
jgi:hypothetical protein